MWDCFSTTRLQCTGKDFFTVTLRHHSRGAPPGVRQDLWRPWATRGISPVKPCKRGHGAPILQIHRWPTDGPAHFRVIYAGASNANCTKHHLFGHSKRPATLFREGAKCFISGARMQGRVAFFPPAFTRAHSSANFQQGQTWRTIVASVIPPTTFAVAPIIAHTKEATHIHSPLKEKLFRLSGWGTPYRRAPGRFECPNQARKPCKRVPPLLKQLST